MVMTFSYIQQDMDLLCRLPFVQVKRMIAVAGTPVAA
jgi:hypothetical protein